MHFLETSSCLFSFCLLRFLKHVRSKCPASVPGAVTLHSPHKYGSARYSLAQLHLGNAYEERWGRERQKEGEFPVSGTDGSRTRISSEPAAARLWECWTQMYALIVNSDSLKLNRICSLGLDRS